MIEILPLEDSWGMPLQVKSPLDQATSHAVFGRKYAYLLAEQPFTQLFFFQKMRTLLALLLKKISTPGRLKKLGFGTRLIDEVREKTYFPRRLRL